MNCRFPLLLSVCFCSFVPAHLRTKPDEYGKYKNIADSIFLANQVANAFSFQVVYDDPDMAQARVAVMIGDVFGNKEKNAVVIYSTSDTSMDLNLFEFKDSKWKALQRQSIEIQSVGALNDLYKH